jgi:hypothetical protein
MAPASEEDDVHEFISYWRMTDLASCDYPFIQPVNEQR